jgi:hypothetical protein
VNTNVLYLEADKRDMVERFIYQMGTQHGYHFRTDGKINWERRLQYEAPWYYVKSAHNQDCLFWHTILFEKVYQENKVPLGCYECWKVVVAPRTLWELFTLLALQLKLDRPGKCGIEGMRANSNKLYGGYFYNKSLEEGKETFKLVKEEIESYQTYDMRMFDVDLKDLKFHADGDVVPFAIGDVTMKGAPKVILKRACTEFEQKCGPSSQWEFDQDDVEDEVSMRDQFSKEMFASQTNQSIKAHLMKMWIHHAYKWGDPTYRHFTQDNELFKPCETYHDLSIEECDKIIKMRRRIPKRPQDKYPEGYKFKTDKQEDKESG